MKKNFLLQIKKKKKNSKSRSFDSVTIEVAGKEETYQILQMFDFNSTRKRMSVITKTPQGKKKKKKKIGNKENSRKNQIVL